MAWQLQEIERTGGLLEDIGRVTVRWSAIDLCLVDIATVALRNGDLAIALLLDTHNAGRQRLETFDKIVRTSRLHNVFKEAVVKETEALRRLLGARNKIVHSPLEVEFTVDGLSLSSRVAEVQKGGIRKEYDRRAVSEHAFTVGEILGRLTELAEEIEHEYAEHPPLDMVKPVD